MLMILKKLEVYTVVELINKNVLRSSKCALFNKNSLINKL